MIKNKKIGGYSLLELLIAMSLGIFIIGTTLHFFETTRKTQRVQSELSDVRENAKFALDMIKEDIQMAGYYGCATRWDESSSVNALNLDADAKNNFKWDFSQALHGNEFNYDESSATPRSWLPVLDTSLNSATWGDVITIRHADRRELNIVSHDDSSAVIKITANNGIRQYDYVLATDCDFSSIFQKTNSTTGSQTIQHGTNPLPSEYAGNRTLDLGKQYPNTAKLMKLYSISYFIKDSNEGVPTLFRINSARNIEQVISGITDMQIQYGVDEDGDQSIDNYYTADAVENNNWWDNVLVVGLTIKAAGYTSDGRNISSLNGTPMEYEISAAINIRNRLP